MVVQVGGVASCVWGAVTSSGVAMVAAAFFAWLAVECVWAAWSRSESTIGARVWHGVFCDIYHSAKAGVAWAWASVFKEEAPQVEETLPVRVVVPLAQMEVVAELPVATREFLEECKKLAGFSLVANLLPFDVCDLEGNRFKVRVTDQWLAICGYPEKGYKGLSEKGRFAVFWSLIYNELPVECEGVVKAEVVTFAEMVSKDDEGNLVNTPLLAAVNGDKWEGYRYFRRGVQNLRLRCVDPVRGATGVISMNVEVAAVCCTVARDILDEQARALPNGFIYDPIFQGEGDTLIDRCKRLRGEESVDGFREDYKFHKFGVKGVERRLNLGHDFGDAELVNECLNEKLKVAWDAGGSLAERAMRMVGQVDERAFFATDIDLSYVVSRERKWLGDDDTVSFESLFQKIRDFCPNLEGLRVPNSEVGVQERVFSEGWQFRSMEALRGREVRMRFEKGMKDEALSLGEGNIKTHTRMMRAMMGLRHLMYTGNLPDLLTYQHRELREDLLSINMDNDLLSEVKRSF